MGLLALLLPQRCVVCALPGSPLCTDCRRSLIRLAPPLCARCGAPGAWPVQRCTECVRRRLGFATARAALVYDARARALVRRWKEDGRRQLSRLAAELVVETVPRPAADAVVWVPADHDRLLTRGVAPPELLARELGLLWELPARSLLRRLRPIRPQRGLSLPERRSNVAGAFGTIAAVPRRLVLVDDVYTTGSTASACAAALRRAGAGQVDVVCLVRAVR
jgi:ComF family protein